MANLPEQVQRQVEEAEATLAAMRTDAPADTIVAPVQGTEAAPSNVQPITTPDDPNSETMAQRWRSLQGVYNATVRQKDALAGRVAQLEQILSTVQQPSQQQAAPTQQSAQRGYITEKDVTDYGDSIDVMRRVAREELAPVISQLQQTMQSFGQNVSHQVQAVANNQQLTREELFYQKLKQFVPGWEQIDQNPGFHQWLSEVDPQTGIMRQVYLDDAHRAFDVQRVAYFFREYAGRMQQQPAAQPGTGVPQTVTNPPQNQLELQVSPGKTRVIAPPVGNPQQGKQWLRSAISKFYDDVRKGLYRGKEAEMAQIENDIIAAGREQRVVAG